MVQERFSTREVTRHTGATARQLQWWDENSLVVPDREANRRVYSLEQILDVQLMLELRRSHLPLEMIQRVLHSFHLKGRPRLSEIVQSSEESYLLVNESGQWLLTSAEEILERIAKVAQPVFLIALSEVLHRYKGFFEQQQIKRPPQRAQSSTREVRRVG